MSENIIHTVETLDTQPFKKMVMTIGELPSSFVESMTYYELLSWFCDYIKNTVIPTVNNNAEAVEELQNLFVELQEYVDDYFENLDVQEEINKKLDQMASDGTLHNILANLFNSYYEQLKEYTDDALTSKVDKDGTGQITVNNLSQAVKEMMTGGSVAVIGTNSVTSANIVDNSIKYQKLDDNGKKGCAGYNQKRILDLDWEQGTRHVNNDGSISPSTNTIVTKETFKLSKGMRIKIQTGYKGAIYSYTQGSRFYMWTGFVNTDRLIGSSYNPTHINDDFYISIRKSDDSDLTPNEGLNAIVITENQGNEKISYSSFDLETQNILMGNIENIKVTDSYSFGLITDNYVGIRYTDGEVGNSTTRAFLNTPIYLPAGTRLTANDDWGFVIVEADSVPTSSKVFYPTGQGYVNEFTVEKSNNYYIAFAKQDNTPLGDIAGQFINHFFISLPNKEGSGTKRVYVSGLGDDTTGNGSAENPFRTINRAIREGAKTIVCAPDFQYDNLVLDNINGLHIIGEIPTYATGDKIQPKPFFDNSISLSQGTLEGNTIKIAYTASENSDMYACLVAKTKNPQDSVSSRSEGYYCTIFSNKGKDSSHRYTPVLTRDNIEGHFFYDGSYIYINKYNDNTENDEFCLVDRATESKKSLVTITNCNDILFENFIFKHSSSQLVYVNKSTNVVMTNCEFWGSSQSDNFGVRDGNTSITECISYLARNDGYNFHGFGQSTVTKCIGCNCFDDGISHHDRCRHIIIGGEYYGNNKGGIASPTYGCSSDIIGAYVHDNANGIHTGSNATYGRSYINLNDNLIINNNVGLRAAQCDGVAFNNKIVDNNTNVVINDSDIKMY